MKRLALRRIRAILAGFLAFSLAGLARAEGRVIPVGPDRELRTPSAAAKVAKDGDTVEIDAGTYAGDVAVWTQRDLTLRGVGGPARLEASGASAEGKGIWVMRGGPFRVENLVFNGARVAHRNGAGIRLEKGSLVVRNCLFEDNENGILTGFDTAGELTIENSEFARNGAGDGQSHNLYVGPLRRLTVTGSYFHHAKVGHLIKSRARENHILYNRLTDEVGGTASYELEITNGGVAYVIGNVIQQGEKTQNPFLVSYGAERYQGDRHELYLVSNTLVDERSGGGFFVRVAPGKVRVVVANNLLIGPNPLAVPPDALVEGNVVLAASELASGAAAYALQPQAARKLAGQVVKVEDGEGKELLPIAEYVHPHSVRNLPKRIKRLPGALQTPAP